MTFIRTPRFFLLLILELSRKYTRWLILGFFIGLTTSLLFWRVFPSSDRWFKRVERIGIIGEFTPTTLPSSILNLISLGLTVTSEDGLAQPGLASSWEITDQGKIFTFSLRSDFHWHNGKQVEAKDINYNIRSVIFEDLNPHLIRVTLTNPYSPFPIIVSKPIFLPGLVGFGYYRVKGIQLKEDKVSYLKLVPVDNQKLPAQEYRFYRTETQALLAFKLGDVDILEDLSKIGDIDKWGKVALNQKIKNNRVVTLFFNLTQSSLSDKNFRQALAYALPPIDEERAYSPISKSSWAYSDKVRKYDPDITKAKTILKDAQISSTSAELTLSTFPQYLALSQSIAASWSSLGIKTNVKVENSFPSGYQVLLSAMDLPPDPDQYPFWHSTQKQTNITGYVNVKIDKLLEDGRQETDLEKRKKIYADFQRRLTDDAPAIFLYYPKTYTFTRNK